jgi:flagellar biosynthesis chaperone FliJ
VNNQRRKELARAVELLSQMVDLHSEAASIITDAAGEEREYYDNMSESLQQGERGERANEAADRLEEIASALDGIDLQQFITDIEEASA